MKKDKVDEALEKMAESLRRLEKNGDIDSFVVIAQRKTSRTTDGMTGCIIFLSICHRERKASYDIEAFRKYKKNI